MKVTERPGSVRHVGTLNEEITQTLSGMQRLMLTSIGSAFLTGATLCDKVDF